MVTSKDCFKKYGDPAKENNMKAVYLDQFEIHTLPNKVYCNKDMIEPLFKALDNVKIRGLEGQIITWDGCFNNRNKKGGRSKSLHAWGLAIDINASWNRYNETPTMSKELVQCFKDAGFDWGGDWSIPDGMHFQLAKI